MNPRIIASVASARLASDSEIPPTPLETILTFAKSLLRSFNAALIASQVPPTSVFMIMLRTFLDSCPRDSNKSPALSSFVLVIFFLFLY